MKKKNLEYRSNLFIYFLGALVLFLELLLFSILTMFLEGGRLAVLLVCILAADAGLYVLFQHLIRRPQRAVRQQILDFLEGRIFEEIFHPAHDMTAESRWMLEKFHTLLDSEKTLELAVEQARYLALQNQINPHFLYNTLDAIRTDALIAGVPSVAKATEALATYFRYTISNLDRYATLTEELNNVEDYMTIQQYRFGDRLQLNLDAVDEACRAYCLPRMTLQPLVENAIYHGLEAKRKMGTVSICVHPTEQMMIIHVIDDGVGIAQAQVDRLNASLGRADSGHIRSEQTRGGIAVRNVNSRIKLLFGEQYGMQIFSEEGRGTDVRITLPAIGRSELEEADETSGKSAGQAAEQHSEESGL